MEIRVLFTAAAFLALSVHCANAQGYTITDLGTLGGAQSYANAVNGGGQVAGKADTSAVDTQGFPVSHAFLYSGGQTTDLGTLPGFGDGSEADGVNDAGQVTGYALESAGYTSHAFLYSGGAMTDLGTLGGSTSVGAAINSSGQVAGLSTFDAAEDFHAFLYSGGQMTDLGTLGGVLSEASGINASGQITGDADTAAGDFHAFLSSGGVMSDLGTLGGSDSLGRAVNAGGQVTGYAATATGAFHAFLYAGGHITDLGTLPGGTESEGRDVNAGGQVVGTSDTGTGDNHAFLYAGGAMTDLNTLLPSGSGWTLWAATAVSDNGQIAGYGVNPQGQTHAFLLTPTAVTPAVSSLSPASRTAGGPAFTLSVSGTGFAANSVVLWNGTTQPTVFVSDTKLTASIPASLIAAAGKVKVTVSTPGVGTSASKTFTINPRPVIVSLSPPSKKAGSKAFTLTVNGTGFLSGSLVKWNGAELATTYVSSTKLTGFVSASRLHTAGTQQISVTTPGVATSANKSFSITP